jgi:hypothetical protein
LFQYGKVPKVLTPADLPICKNFRIFASEVLDDGGVAVIAQKPAREAGF